VSVTMVPARACVVPISNMLPAKAHAAA